jgi:hypothetical protein
MNAATNSSSMVPATGYSVYISQMVGHGAMGYGPGHWGYSAKFASNAGNPCVCVPSGRFFPGSTASKHGSITRLQAMLWCTQPCTYSGYWTGTYTMGWVVDFGVQQQAPVVTDIYHHGDTYDWMPTAMYRYTTKVPSGNYHWTRDWCGGVKGAGYQAYHHGNSMGSQVNACNACSSRIACGCIGYCPTVNTTWQNGGAFCGINVCGGAISTQNASYIAFVTYYGNGCCYNDSTYNYSRIDGNSWRTCWLYTPSAHLRCCGSGNPSSYCGGITGIGGSGTGGVCVMAQSPKVCNGSSAPFGIGSNSGSLWPHRAFCLYTSIGRSGSINCHCSSSLWSGGLGFWGNWYYQYGYADFSTAQ